MDYKAEISRMVSEMKCRAMLRKIYKVVKLLYEAERGH